MLSSAGKIALGFLAVAAGAKVLGGSSTPSRSKKRRRGGTTKGGGTFKTIPMWCTKLGKNPTPAERAQQIVDEVTKADAEIAPWDGASLPDARQRAFAVSMTAMGKLCPGIELPSALHTLENYLKSKPDWWGQLYQLVHAQAWHMTTGA